MALGALQSIQQAGRTVGKDIYLVGVDALAEAVQDVLDGNMTGTVLNDDVGQATAAAEATKLYVEGSAVEQALSVVYAWSAVGGHPLGNAAHSLLYAVSVYPLSHAPHRRYRARLFHPSVP